ncbi:ribosomal protein small subunit S27 [Thermoplasma volcanium GSS1]|uniref:Small ribosomal subunit protein eS27 n=1 Tax=Thermoplasma volcanium (strain ATCC 51530 / DSM 4299 / JCM 9571 / NBRC 15438 / GSS1) TaxID=273116 RepID=RS27_THEVO|nr:30S ribosomal protein S27e [Thermoplasma volcanium]Q97BP1.1 RecName: Full=Small ribosomal subunit protein eS27; AltName: Full=30S ribosomal protein S27e [Thermoplasma volcanium GSS1]BAB59556.1 ribosomal protein small subunit S27 [Thermoplasma volcanium GSS1]
MSEVKFVKPKNVSGHFLKIKCKDCGNVQVVFARPSSVVTCNICGATIAKPTGGVLETSGEVIESL